MKITRALIRFAHTVRCVACMHTSSRANTYAAAAGVATNFLLEQDNKASSERNHTHSHVNTLAFVAALRSPYKPTNQRQAINAVGQDQACFKVFYMHDHWHAPRTVRAIV